MKGQRCRQRVGMVALLIGALVTSTSTGVALGQSGSYPKGERQGDAVIVEGGPGGSRPIGKGGSETLFSLALPSGATCPGDSANDGFRVQGFMVPAIDDPGSLRYKSIQPEGDGRWGLFDEHTASYAQRFTAKRDKPGGPGMLLELPRFTLSVFPPGTLQPGNYRIGIACTLYNETITYWDSPFFIADDSSDKPAGIRWQVPGYEDRESGSEVGDSTAVLASIAASVALLGISVAVSKSRKRQRAIDPSDKSR